jgi:hypothetical protein
MVVSGDVDAVTAVELQHAAIDVLRWQRPPFIDIDMAQVGLLDCAGARWRRLPLVSDGYRKPDGVYEVLYRPVPGSCGQLAAWATSAGSANSTGPSDTTGSEAGGASGWGRRKWAALPEGRA